MQHINSGDQSPFILYVFITGCYRHHYYLFNVFMNKLTYVCMLSIDTQILLVALSGQI